MAKGTTLTREWLRSGELRRMLVERDPAIDVLSAEAVEKSRRSTLDGRDLSNGVWLFGYGSLIWNPIVEIAERRVGVAHGYHRRFCIWTILGRGSREIPGLLLALERGGACRGVLLRIAPEHLESELDLIWQREMLTSVYHARWLRVRTEEGPVQAIAFVANRAHPRYAGRLPIDRVVETLATAHGPLGTSAEYLVSTVAHLRDLDICEPGLASLCDRVTSHYPTS
jgi:cation transport protein ChaC